MESLTVNSDSFSSCSSSKQSASSFPLSPRLRRGLLHQQSAVVELAAPFGSAFEKRKLFGVVMRGCLSARTQ
jgi:hypothetical protein